MKIGLICPYSLTVPGGVQDQVLGLGRALMADGIDARVLAPCDGPPPESFVTPLGSSLPTAANGSVAPIAPDPPAQLRLIRAVRDERFDLLHLHEPMAPGATQTAVYLRLAPLIGTFHAAGNVGSYAATSWALKRFARRLEVRFVVSDEARELALRLLGGTYVDAFNGVEVRRFDEIEPSATTGPTVLFVGRHDERKGLSILLEALNWLGPEVQLWVVGEGPETERLRNLHAGDGRIHWMGRIGDREKVSRMKGADVVVAPSLGGESFGIVLLEAFAAGTPLVASGLPGYRRVAEGAAELTPPGDARAVAAAISRVLADDALSDTLVAAGRMRVEDFSMQRLASFYRGHYEEVLERLALAPPRPARRLLH